MSTSIVSGTGVLAAYVTVFAAAGIICFAALPRARRISDPDTRRGLVALLAASGGWATAHVGFLVAPTPGLKEAFYVAGLVIGFGAVGTWLYFCSAYTGRTLHRDRTIRRIAIVVFVAVVLVKVTNPVHGLYYTATYVTTPFPHLAIHHGIPHWLTMGFSYALAAVGYFMLLELFTRVSYETTALVVLVGLTGLPVVLDVVGLVTPFLLDIPYEPIGVAAFAVGVLTLYQAEFQAVQLAGGQDAPVIVLDDDGRIREFNDTVRDLFPTVMTDDAVGEPLDVALPKVSSRLDEESPILEIEGLDHTRYYEVTSSPFHAGRHPIGRLVTIRDVTDQEQYRRELERQNERLETFASMVSHDLRNPLTVAKGRVDLAQQETGNENLEMARDALDRMETLIEDLLALAREGTPVDEREPVSLSSVVRDAWSLVETRDAELVVDDATIDADPDRLQQLVENLLRNAIEHGGTDVTVRIGPLDDGFFVEDDGPGIPEADRETVFESGFSTADDGTGFGLAIVREIAEAHGWEVTATAGMDGGARFEIRHAADAT